MSLPVFVWVLDNSEATLGGRLVLLVLAEHAHDDGRESYPALDTIARRSRLSRKGARDALKRLEREGHIERDGQGDAGQVKWRVIMPGGTTPPADRRGVGDDVRGGVVASSDREASTPEPTTEPSNTEPSPINSPPWPDSAIPTTVNRKHVRVAEAALAGRVLAYWQRRTGVTVTDTDVARAIIGRIRTDPDLTADDHKRIIDTNLARPWWEGKAPPTVLYGNGKAWAAAKARGAGGSRDHPDQGRDHSTAHARDKAIVDAAVADARTMEDA